MLIYCLLETGGGEGAAKMKIVFRMEKMSSFYKEILRKSSSYLRIWRQWGGGGRQSENCLKKTKNEHYFFIKHPLVSILGLFNLLLAALLEVYSILGI